MAARDELLCRAENEYDGFRVAVNGLDDGERGRRRPGRGGVRSESS